MSVTMLSSGAPITTLYPDLMCQLSTTLLSLILILLMLACVLRVHAFVVRTRVPMYDHDVLFVHLTFWLRSTKRRMETICRVGRTFKYCRLVKN